MQDTRLSQLLSNAIAQVEQWFLNPWRRFSLLTISLLGGFFLSSTITTTTGQQAELDIFIAGIIVAIIEVMNFLIYSGRSGWRRRLAIECLNALKIGLLYGLALEALKLGS
ncbi:MAG: DUF565 domain-containing protein [Synechococcales bacterium]|nr:DUF565 domain-containing protein [Synechococcales bacterium]